MKITGEGCRETKENGHEGADERKQKKEKEKCNTEEKVERSKVEHRKIK